MPLLSTPAFADANTDCGPGGSSVSCTITVYEEDFPNVAVAVTGGELGLGVTIDGTGSYSNSGQNGLIFQTYGVVPSDDTPYGPQSQGGPLSVTNQADMTLTGIFGSYLVYEGSGQPALGGAVIVADSFGAEGFADSEKDPNPDNFNGSPGGTVTLVNDGTLSVAGNGGFLPPGEGQTALLTDPTLTALGAYSFGGEGVAIKAHDTDWAGAGGDGGTVSVTNNSAITISNAGPLATYGIYALSRGGVGSNRKNYADADGGSGGTVTVTQNGSISSTAPLTVGILAASVGGDSDFDDKNDGGDASGAGDGGSVSVEITDGAAVTTGGGVGIGVMALSAGGSADNGWEGTGGTVTVTVDDGGTIDTTASNQSLSVGVLAVSAGNLADVLPFATSEVNSSYPGHPGDVTVTNNGSIRTAGSLAVGVAALSVGGATIVTNADASGSSVLGNTGSVGGFDGQSATVTNNGSITTNGAGAFGIVAISAGNGGGLLNLESADQALTVGGGTNVTEGGNAAAVNVTNGGSITTGDGNGGGKVAIGIVAQSIGGGGGSSNAPSFFVGGHDADGSGGGNGGEVTVTTTAASTITTSDDGALGILAQSVGGGGGNGANAAGVFVATGGQGGQGGDGGSVDVELTNTAGGGIYSTGDFAGGVLAQSIGGGGGNGGYAKTTGPIFSVGIGGAGGDGGKGVDVTVRNVLTIATGGNQSFGILAQSVGGGGGSGGATHTTAFGPLAVAVAVGGYGGGGGDGGTVDVTNDFHIYTGCASVSGGCTPPSSSDGMDGADAIGIVAQSIGGGGGNGGNATAKSLGVPGGDEIPFEFAVSASIGGQGGVAGDAAAVSVANAGEVVTIGNGSYGVLAQSIGGGGGNGGDSTATAKAVSSDVPTITTSVSIGGLGAAAGDGSGVTVTNGASATCGGCNGQIVTVGADAAGILAQSIGGSGGTGGTGNASTGSVDLSSIFGDDSDGDGGGGSGSEAAGSAVQALAALPQEAEGDDSGGDDGGDDDGSSLSVSVTVGVGGAGGSGGSGGTVQVTNDSGSTIRTIGSGAQGVLAQSIGGGGGAAGSGGTSGGGGDTVTAAVTLGGNGGSGNDGGQITVENDGVIATGYRYTDVSGRARTSGTDAVGILAQSIGGGGGVAGSSDGSPSDDDDGSGGTFGGSASVGGSGNGGGDGGSVSVSNTGSLGTLGIRAYGIEAQSIGGGGGDGGTASANSSGTYSASVGVGGSGGAAGSGGTVGVDNSGSISTEGYGAHAVLAQSIGGGGGVGKSGSAGETAGSGDDDSSGDGSGDDNGGGGSGDDAGGGSEAASAPLLLAEAEGDDGGDDGGSSFSFTASAGVGGSGGGGGSGGAVTVTNEAGATIRATGSGANGIVAQSIGGGGGVAAAGTGSGGSGSTIDLGIGVGGNGGAAANGGTVTVSNDGMISTGAVHSDAAGQQTATTGGDSIAILAQSIGGGGGLAGSATASAGDSSDDDDSSSGYTATVAVGGKGGAGGSGGMVSVASTGAISTLGARGYGIEAQSVGGGGGNGGAASSTTGGDHSAAVAVGSGGGAAGNGGQVTVANSGTITTAGYAAHAILAHSIGGGGGVGADGSVNNSATLGVGAGVNGDGGAGGDGNSVEVGQSGGLQTAGDDAYGILAQSIGGGGGTATGGCSNSGSGSKLASQTLCLGNKTGGVDVPNPIWNDSSDFTLEIGGKAGSYGNGGTVTIDHTAGSIVTTGARAMAIVAQSIGGGGGLVAAADANAGNISFSNVGPGNGGSIGITLGTNGGEATAGAITTYGDGAWGVFAQSIGYGGGFGGDSSLGLALQSANYLTADSNSSDTTNGGAVTVDLYGNVTTSGANAHGLFLQSIGGGGGVEANDGQLQAGNLQSTGTVGLYRGGGGTIVVNQYAGAISTTGAGSVAIFAQSTGNDTGSQSPIDITVGGTVSGGTGAGAAGILVSGGVSSASTTYDDGIFNTIKILPGGSVGTADGIAGMAIMAADSVTNIVNGGTIVGSVNLGTGNVDGNDPGSIQNNGSFDSGTVVMALNFTNAGTLAPGGGGAIATTAFSHNGNSGLPSNFDQVGGGTLAVDVDSLAAGQTADLLAVTGDVTLDGTIAPTASNLLPGRYVVVTATGSLDASAAVAQQGLLFGWGVDTGTPGEVAIVPQAKLAPEDGSPSANEGKVADYLQTLWDDGGSDGLAPLFGRLSRLQSGNDYKDALKDMSPENIPAHASDQAVAARTSLSSAMSCPGFEAEGVILRETSCVWTKVGGGHINRYEDGKTPGYGIDSAMIRFGGQKEVRDDWFLGATAAYGRSWAKAASGGSRSDGESVDASLALKHTSGPWYFAGGLGLGYGWYDNTRKTSIGGVPESFDSNSKVYTLGGRLRVAYEVPFDGWYLRPYADFDAIYTHSPGYREDGSSPLALDVKSQSKTTGAFSPMLEAGGRLDLSDGWLLRFYAAGGGVFLSDDSWTTRARLQGAPAGSGTFSTESKLPRQLGTLDLGLQLYQDQGLEVRIEYGLQAGEHYLGQTGSARVGFRF